MTIIIDSSMAAAWCFEDEESDAASEVLETVGKAGAIVPGHWAMEVANMLIQAERRKRIQPSDVAQRLSLLRGLPIEVDGETNERAWAETLSLARSERLSAYDAAYLELALRRRHPLATKDRELARAAERRGVEVLAA